MRTIHSTQRTEYDDVRALVEELLRTGVLLVDVLGAILDELAPDAFPGESSHEVLVEMVVGTVGPAAGAAGPDAVRQATALIGAVHDRVTADLKAALELASEG